MAFDSVEAFAGEGDPVDAEVITGSTIFGLAMFSTLFLGAVLAVFSPSARCAVTPSEASCSRWSCGPSDGRSCWWGASPPQ